MRIKTKKRIARALVALIIAATIVGALLVVNASAETTTVALKGNCSASRHEAAKKTRTGLYKRGGNWYYGHKTNSALYKVGDLTRDSFRIINGKYYYFCHNGKMLKHSTHYMQLGKKDKSGKREVLYVYSPGSKKQARFNTRLHRGQRKKHGKWITEPGMQYDLYGQIDMQP